MIPFNQEPSFVKKFVWTPRCPFYERSVERLGAEIKSESGVYVSPKSCFVVTPEFIASIFVIGFREIITYPGLRRLDNLSSTVAEPVERHYHNKDYVILLIHSPSLDVKKERELVEFDYKIREESRKRKEEERRIREHKEALEAM